MSSVGLVPALALVESAGLRDLADQYLTVPTDKGANPGLKAASLVAGMVAGAESIDDMTLLRHGGMGRVFARAYAPSTLGSFLRAFTFGHVRQLDAVATRFLVALAGHTELRGDPASPVDPGSSAGYALLDVDDTIVEVHGHAKQGAGVRLLRGPWPERAARDTRDRDESRHGPGRALRGDSRIQRGRPTPAHRHFGSATSWTRVGHATPATTGPKD